MAIAFEPGALSGAGLPAHELREWAASQPRDVGDAAATSRFLLTGERLLGRLPPRPKRSTAEQAAAEALWAELRAVRRRFLRVSAGALYARLTGDLSKCVRVEELVYDAAAAVPGLVPTREQVRADRERLQKDKEGFEIDQGVFLAQVLSDPAAGSHLIYSMLRPRHEAVELFGDFQRSGRVDIGDTSVERRGSVGYVLHGSPRFLNAEDDATTTTLEIGVDLVLLDPAIEVGVLRGKPVTHPKYAGRRLFSSGINLTHLYHGLISFVDFFISRELGLVNKLYRGHSLAEYVSHAVEETSSEKPWVAAVEGFAIGGGCQILLTMDYVLAEQSSFFSLPARKEGIIPGVSNMRLWRFVGDRLARQAILFDRQFPADSAEGRLICDRVVPDGEMDAALSETLVALTTSGVVSAAGNRKAIRVGQEPIDVFRQYMAVYCREQALCHYSPQLIRNLELNWDAQRRKP
ncbi:MAG: enoyl-CoA hydratase/isomerase family protein [Chloroflexi bacterium]|nr:enoyl-CoA hydratase/isomerase family protein [Chloroflexota bacterium]